MQINTVQDFRQAVRRGPYAWPGGYAVFFVVDDGECLCFTCAQQERRNIIASIVTQMNDGWRVIAVECTANTDTPTDCAHCGATIVEEPEPVVDESVVYYTLPVYWASYLINGDATGLEDGEQERIDAFLRKHDLADAIDVSEDSWFAWRNDAGTLGGDVATYTFPRRDRTEA